MQKNRIIFEHICLIHLFVSMFSLVNFASSFKIKLQHSLLLGLVFLSGCTGYPSPKKISLGGSEPVPYVIDDKYIAADGKFYTIYVSGERNAEEKGIIVKDVYTLFNERMTRTYKPTAFIRGNDPVSGDDILFAVIMRHREESGRYLIAFRGTMSYNEALIDLDSKKVDFVDIVGQTDINRDVHGGFFKLYASLRADVFLFLKNNDAKTIDVACHSLGCGVGFLFLYDALKNADVAMPTVKKFSFYGYGSPRVGGGSFVQALDSVLAATKLEISYVNFINTRDVVPTLPPVAFGYADNPGGYRMCYDKSKTSKDGNSVTGFRHTYYSNALNEILLGDPKYADAVGMEFCSI